MMPSPEQLLYLGPVAITDRSAAESPPADQVLPVRRRVGERLRCAIYDLHSGIQEQRPFGELLARLVDEHRAMVGDYEIQLEIGDGVPAGSRVRWEAPLANGTG
jgi:hypothetical protein